jgi:hypothetical protein
MSADQMPEWLQRRHSAVASFEAERQTQKIAYMTVKAEGEAFWSQVCASLKVVADNPPAGLWARFHHAPDAMNEQKDHCRIEVGCSSFAPKHSYTDLWYIPGEAWIRYRPISGVESSLRLCVVDDKVCAVDRSESMSPQMVARLIAEPLIEYAMAAALAGVS